MNSHSFFQDWGFGVGVDLGPKGRLKQLGYNLSLAVYWKKSKLFSYFGSKWKRKYIYCVHL